MTNPENGENRIETRLVLMETVFIEILASSVKTPGSVIICNSLDLSANGLQVVTDEDIPAGSILRLCIDMNHRDPIFLVGEVKWQRPDTETDGMRIGFLLFESEDTDIQAWKELVAELLEN